MRAVWRGVQTAATAVTGWFGGGKRRREDDDDKEPADSPGMVAMGSGEVMSIPAFLRSSMG